MKQTVVDIIYDFMYKMKSFGEFDPYHFNTAEVFKKLKQMEKEQIKQSFVECWKANVPDGVECKLDAEQYYNKIFK